MASLIVAGAALGAMAPSAFAEDGFPDVLSAIFGGGGSQTQPREVPEEGARPHGSAAWPGASRGRYAQGRPLTVKLHRPKPAQFAARPVAPGAVSIFEDKTLRRGDAVMTRHGIRIFAGSKSWPYRDGDFVAVSEAGRMDKGVQKTLVSLDSLPRD